MTRAAAVGNGRVAWVAILATGLFCTPKALGQQPFPPTFDYCNGDGTCLALYNCFSDSGNCDNTIPYQDGSPSSGEALLQCCQLYRKCCSAPYRVTCTAMLAYFTDQNLLNTCNMYGPLCSRDESCGVGSLCCQDNNPQSTAFGLKCCTKLA